MAFPYPRKNIDHNKTTGLKLKLLTLSFLCILTVSLACAQVEDKKVEELFEALQLKEGSRVADIGSREGYYTIRMSPIVGNTGHIFAVDINSDALEKLHANVEEHNLENITPVFSMPENPMLPPESVDAVLIRNTYHEFTNPESMLSHIKKALKPGGRLVLSEPIKEEYKDKRRDYQTDYHFLGINFAREELKKEGFEIQKEVERFTEEQDGEHYWLIIATRPEK